MFEACEGIAKRKEARRKTRVGGTPIQPVDKTSGLGRAEREAKVGGRVGREKEREIRKEKRGRERTTDNNGHHE